MSAPPATTLRIRPLRVEEVDVCAGMLAGSDPWVTLGWDAHWAATLLRDPTRKVHVAECSGFLPVGVLVLCLCGALVGYIQAICVAPAWRGQGTGSALLAFAEERIFRVSPNVFLCVCSFNTLARQWYLRHGYAVVGELRDYIVSAYSDSEFLLRKTRGPLRDFPPPQPGASADLHRP